MRKHQGFPAMKLLRKIASAFKTEPANINAPSSPIPSGMQIVKEGLAKSLPGWEAMTFGNGAESATIDINNQLLGIADRGNGYVDVVLCTPNAFAWLADGTSVTASYKLDTSAEFR